MPFDPGRHHRGSTRLSGYDYTAPGWYFVTICTYQRLGLFDDPRLRGVAEELWRALPRFDPFVGVDEWVVMPNHVHGIIEIRERPAARQPHTVTTEGNVRATGIGINVTPGALGTIVRSYKAMVTRRANRITRQLGGPIWQRGFWERVICDEHELEATRQYIQDNPRRWAEDRDNLDALLARMNAD